MHLRLKFPKAVVQRCSVKQVFLETSQNSQESTCARVSFLIKLQASGLRPATLLKKRLWHRCFPENFVKFIRRPFFIEHLWWLHLNFMEVNILVADLREVTKNWMVLLVFREGCLCRNCTLYVRIIVTSHDILHSISCVWRYSHAPPPLSLSFLTCFFYTTNSLKVFWL